MKTSFSSDQLLEFSSLAGVATHFLLKHNCHAP